MSKPSKAAEMIEWAVGYASKHPTQEDRACAFVALLSGALRNIEPAGLSDKVFGLLQQEPAEPAATPALPPEES